MRKATGNSPSSLRSTQILRGWRGLGKLSRRAAGFPSSWRHSFQAYQWLFVFERELRTYVARRLSDASHRPWETRLPAGMHDKWQSKKAEALAKGEAEQPLISYADFSDYTDIVLGRANWRDCFQS